MAEAAPHLRPMIALALNTGMRLGEILKLRREHINFTTRMITVPAENSKSKKSRQIPMNEMVLDLIRGPAPAEGDCGVPTDGIGVRVQLRDESGDG